jgi:hypothetical protein
MPNNPYQLYVQYCRKMGISPMEIELWEFSTHRLLNSYGQIDKGEGSPNSDAALKGKAKARRAKG